MSSDSTESSGEKPEEETRTIPVEGAGPEPIPSPDAEAVANPDADVAERAGGDAPAEEETTSPEDELAKWKDLALRGRADLENYRKRVAREQADIRQYAKADLLRGLLPVIDHFEMGLEAARQEGEGSMLFQGMAMVARQLTDFLAAEGVEEIAIGEAFDPNSQEAVSQEASDELPEGGVIRVTRKGYQMGERLLRPANVIVSSGAATEGD